MTTVADAPLQRLQDQVRAAHAHGTALRIRGGGTKDFYGGAPTGTALTLAELRGISCYEPTEMVVTVRAGTPLAELEAALAEKGQCLAFEPPRFAAPPAGGGTVGGMVAAGLSGPARGCVGGLRDYVLGVTMLNGKGELLQFGGQVMKNVAGYDVSRVLAGAMGVLGVICEVSLKVPPLPAARQTLLVSCSQEQALRHLHAWSAAALPLRASAWHDGRLHLRLEGAAAAVASSAAQLARQHGAEALAPADAQSYWDGLRDQRAAFFRGPEGQTLWRLSLPSRSAPLPLDADCLIEWGGAQRWLHSAEAPDRMRALARQAGGHATAFRGASDRSQAFAPLAPALVRVHRALKTAFDPAGIFNPGRLYPWL